jgi:hypothetical protein
MKFVHSSLRLTLGLGLAALPACNADAPPGAALTTADATAARSWCDPATWGGSAPTQATDVTVSGSIVVDCAAVARKVTIPSGATLTASRTLASSLTLTGNLVVQGRLDYGTPGDRIAAGVQAQIVFRGMKDSAYRGTPSPVHGDAFGPPRDVAMAVVDSDVGLWVMGSGVFTAAGQAKAAWSKLTDGAKPGDPTFTVEAADGWQPGDRIVLTPTAASATPDFATQFDEGTLASITGTTGVLAAAPAFSHAGCSGAGCLRRGEAANLSRNVVVRSFDTTAHAHIMVAQQGVLQLDSVELRDLGPSKACSAGGPDRRAAIYFHEQGDASRSSFVRHAAIWRGKNHFVMVEKSHGVQISDTVGYDTAGNGFAMFFDDAACGTRCQPAGAMPRDVVFDHVLSAKVAVPSRVEGCAAIGAVSALVVSGDDSSGAVNSIATGAAYNYEPYGNTGAIDHAETGAGTGNVFHDNEAHDNNAHGVGGWQNGTSNPGAPYSNIRAWSNLGDGIHHGAYGNDIVYQSVTAFDNAEANFGVVAITVTAGVPRIDGAVLDDLQAESYFAVPSSPVVFRNLRFTGARSPAITQDHDECDGGNENDPNDATCIRTWIRFENPRFVAGTMPFDFGGQRNKFALWEIRGFSHPDYSALPVNFDLYRKDNQVAGGSYNAAFDAWLVPR